MHYDDHGFRLPEEFSESRRPARRQITAGRVLLLFGLVAVATGLAVLVEYGPDIQKRLEKLLASAQHQHADDLLHRVQRNLGPGGDQRQALSDLSTLIRYNPRNLELRMFRASLLAELGRYREAIEDCNTVLKSKPSRPDALNNRAYFRALERIDLDEALSDVTKAIEGGGAHSAYVDTRAYLHYLMGRHQDALKDFDSILENEDMKAMNRHSTLGEIYFHRGLVHKALGNKAQAEADFNEARRLGFSWQVEPRPVRGR